ncbi:MAG: hypothetical protein ACTSYQ_03775 [Candidatus Odinarchaeia archaeon]
MKNTKQSDKENKISEITIYDLNGRPLVSYNLSKSIIPIKQLTNYNNLINCKEIKIDYYDYNLWLKKKDSLIFSVKASKNINREIVEHIINLISKPLLQIKIEDNQLEYFKAILKACSLPSFIKILKEHFGN